ncbi:hypothetical protein F5146DRAFT_1226974 [Armillaria mellea]|nr:hypothetical protein F5146DRAFT_1226974 [Armillaria mellea]
MRTGRMRTAIKGVALKRGVCGDSTWDQKGTDRCGELVIDGPIPHTFKIRATHHIPIPDDIYTLIGGHFLYPAYWAVGRRQPDRRFEKVSVIVLDGDEKEVWLKVWDLNLEAHSRIVLI